jgi:hypothetical protein
VVNTFNAHIEGRLHEHCKLAEFDLWQKIFALSEPGCDYVIVRWMPSHMDEPKRIEEKTNTCGKG